MTEPACHITKAHCHLQGVRRDAQPCSAECDLAPTPTYDQLEQIRLALKQAFDDGQESMLPFAEGRRNPFTARYRARIHKTWTAILRRDS